MPDSSHPAYSDSDTYPVYLDVRHNRFHMLWKDIKISQYRQADPKISGAGGLPNLQSRFSELNKSK